MYDRLLIAGTRSGCGKTTVTCAVLGALKKRGLALQSFKCGPDYIDPMFHRRVLGVPARNLDPFFSTPEQLRGQMGDFAEKLCVAEGVMGYYDGIGTEGAASTYHVAAATDTPVVLVLDAKGAFTSLGAVLTGFRDFRSGSNIRGVIFNGASEMLYPSLCEIARNAGVTPYGFLPRCPEAVIGSRHLGLITADEIADLQQRLDVLAALAEQHLDIDGLLALAGEAGPLPRSAPITPAVDGVRIAVARDEAFCFLYAENLALLSSLGAELCYFSPLHDSHLPKCLGGLYLPGGYPELYLTQLSNNPIRNEIAGAITAGLPTFAECGGFLYLHDSLDGVPMAGVIHASAHRTERLQRFGYVTLRAETDNLLCDAGETIPAHEFHYYDSTDNGNTFTAVKPTGSRSWRCVHGSETVWAGFPHLYFPANPDFARRFLRKAAEYAAV